jgi:hypothetical protein
MGERQAIAIGRIGLALSLLLPASARGGETFMVAAATSATPLRIVLTWPSARDAAGKPIRRYQLFRKIDPAAPYPEFPIATLDFPASEEDLDRFLTFRELARMAEALGDAPPKPSDPPVNFDLNRISELGPGSRNTRKFERLQMMAQASWRIAVAIGQGFLDTAVQDGQLYIYQLKGVSDAGPSISLAAGIQVRAGRPVLPPAPTGLTAQEGDSAVLLWWNDVPGFGDFRVYRKDSSGGPEVRVNPQGFGVRIFKDLKDADVNGKAGAPGFLDVVDWDEVGDPRPRPVGGGSIFGPLNGTTYEYRVAAADFLENEGALSTTVTASPLDVTPPATAGDVSVTPRDEIGSLEIRWSAVRADVLGHKEADPAGIGYRVFRYDGPGDPAQGATPVTGWTSASPSDLALLSAYDSSAVLRPAYGEKTFWYRVVVRDDRGNESAFSDAVSGFLRDKTPPAPPVILGTEGKDESIAVSFQLSPEVDVESYQVYRSLCDGGKWVEKAPVYEDLPLPPGGDSTWFKQSWVLVGAVSHKEAAKMAVPTFEDRTVPPKSPLCFAYLVKALDRAQNLSGSWPIDPPSFPGEDYLCQRLRDTDPPKAPIVTALEARDGDVEVEWIGEPIQDIAAYYVYRAAAEAGPYQFVGGRTVPFPKATPPIAARDLLAPLPVPDETGCALISLLTRKEMSECSFLDRGQVLPLEPKKVYWYKVTGVDQTGRETPIDHLDVVPVSTFTFSTARPSSPSITAVVPSALPRSITVRWSPAFDPAAHVGFSVLRSRDAAGPFRQVGSLVKGANEYRDAEVAGGATYWYQVVVIDAGGRPSLPSPGASGVVP